MAILTDAMMEELRIHRESKPPLCPILTMKSEYEEVCLDDGCAWFANGECAIKNIATMLEDIMYKLNPAVQPTYTTARGDNPFPSF